MGHIKEVRYKNSLVGIQLNIFSEAKFVRDATRKSISNLSEKIAEAEAQAKKSKEEKSKALPPLTKRQQTLPSLPASEKPQTLKTFMSKNKSLLQGFGITPPQVSNKRAQLKYKVVLGPGQPAPTTSLPPLPNTITKESTGKPFPLRSSSFPLPPIGVSNVTESRVQEAMCISIPGTRSLVSPINWQQNNDLSCRAVRLKKHLYVSAFAADQAAGFPFEAFLQRTGNPGAIKSMHFWHESVIYLSTKKTTMADHYDHIRLRRARKLIFQHLAKNAVEEVDIPTKLTLVLLNLLPIGRGDEFLRCAQDSVSEVR